MKTLLPLLLTTLVTAGGSLAKVDAPLALERTIPLPGVSGRIDHLSIDTSGKRLFVAALGNNSVEIIDLSDGKRVGTISGLSEPQGVLFIPGLNRIVVANGGDGSVRFYDGKSLKLVTTAKFKEDADNLRYDPSARRVYVGYGRGGIGVLDAETGEKIADTRLPGHPESFQFETNGARIFVNIPSARQVVVVDRIKGGVIATWQLKEAHSNFPMALDDKNHRLFIGCRLPARLLVLDTESGMVIASMPCAGDADDVFYDPAGGRIYVSGGEGRVDTFKQADADHYSLVSQTPTAVGARTSLFSPDMKALFVAVPRTLLRPAQILQYSTPSAP